MSLSAPPLDVIPDLRPIVGGARHDGDAVAAHRHVYAATGQETVAIPLYGQGAVDAAVHAARVAQPRWAATSGAERREALARAATALVADADRLSTLQTVESGTPVLFTRPAPRVAADYLAYYAGWADKGGGRVIDTWPQRGLDYAVDEPYGVVGVIVPWNAPLVAFGQIAGAALAAGNTVVVKPSALCPFTCLRMAEVLEASGLPAGVVNVVPGGALEGTALVGHEDVDKIHFTGGSATARRVAGLAGQHLTPVALELGGKAAHVVFADADLKAAARQVLSSVIVNSGQGCVNGSRVLVERSVYDQVLALVVRRLGRVAIGDPLAPSTIMGPVVSEDARARIVGLVERGVREGQGRLVHGGGPPGDHLAGGSFVEPAVFGEVLEASELGQAEIFGPVLAFLPFDGDDEAVRKANATRYGLAAYLHTRDLRRAHRVAARLEAGNIWINGFHGVPPSMPFGGTKESGYGRAGGRAGLDEFLRPKNVWLGL